jgi:hypothetical protein
MFFVPSPANGMIKQELYFELVNAHHEHMANIRSFAISGISNLNSPMLVQVNTEYGHQLVVADHTEAAHSYCHSPWNEYRNILIRGIDIAQRDGWTLSPVVDR